MVNIAILGNGTVGSGVIELIQKNVDKLKERTGEEVRIAKVLVKDTNKHLNKWVSPLLTERIEDIYNENLDIVVEVMGGLDPAYDYIKQFLKMKKHVVTANKDLISKYGTELLDLANENGVRLHFEASVGGGIPILKPLSQGLAGNEIRSITAILNGTTNFILTKMSEENMDYQQALSVAQELGFAEADPSSDVLGLDSARKLGILSSISYNEKVNWEQIEIKGINQIEPEDILYAKRLNCRVKLVAISIKEEDGIYASVQPVLIHKESEIGKIENEFNGILIEGDAVGKVFFSGKGAGKLPTASAVFGDILDILENRRERIISFSKKEANIKTNWTKKGEWMLRVKSEERVKTISLLAELFSNCSILNDMNNKGDEVVACVKANNEDELNARINKLSNYPSIRFVKKFLKLEAI